MVMPAYLSLRLGSGKYRSHLGLPASASSVAIMITSTLLSQTMRQKCGMVVASGLDAVEARNGAHKQTPWRRCNTWCCGRRSYECSWR